MTAATTKKTKLTPEQQSAVLYWPTKAKIPIIPCDSKAKGFNFPWKDADSTAVDWGANLASGLYDNGIALKLGKTLPGSPYPYCFALDFDGIDAVMEFFGIWDNVLSLSKRTRIEWHQDKGRLHIVFLSEKNVTKKRIKVKETDAAFEVRYDELLIVSPSIHGDGSAWTVLEGGTDHISTLSDKEVDALEAKINALSRVHKSDEDKQAYIEWLERSDTIIRDGEGRHIAVKTLGCSYYYRYKDEWKDLTDDQRHDKLQEWNQQHCIPPLPEAEFSEIWKWIVDNHRKTRDERNEKLDDERRKAAENNASNADVILDDNIKQELQDTVYYIVKSKPLTVVSAYTNTKMLIESVEKTFENEVFDKTSKEKTSQKIKVLSQKKLYLTCIPTSITKHKNPLSFLEATPKYTMTFVDSVGNHLKFKYKTLSEIIAGLRDNGYVQSDGAEGALGVMILAFTKNKLLVENCDMEYTGFFLDDNKRIIASNIEIKNEVSIEGLREALKAIEQAATKYYSPNPDRLDLIATSIVWAMVAPISFIFKSNVYYLRWFHLWGFSNATKSNTGILVLAIDEHHKDSKFVRNISNIDTIARFGDELSKTTFPKMFDEVNLTDEKYKHIPNK